VRIGKPDFPEPCNPVTEASAMIDSDCTSATITWTMVDEAKGYKISRDGTILDTVDAPPYIEEFDFEDGEIYIWEIVSVCNSGESEEVTVSATANCSQGIHEFSSNVDIFPNPGNNRFLIQTELIHFTLQLYDLQGQLRLTQQNRKEVDTEKLPSGCYIYRIIAEDGKATSGKWMKR
jgi:hypothetical protein